MEKITPNSLQQFTNESNQRIKTEEDHRMEIKCKEAHDAIIRAALKNKNRIFRTAYLGYDLVELLKVKEDDVELYKTLYLSAANGCMKGDSVERLNKKIEDKLGGVEIDNVKLEGVKIDAEWAPPNWWSNSHLVVNASWRPKQGGVRWY